MKRTIVKVPTTKRSIKASNAYFNKNLVATLVSLLNRAVDCLDLMDNETHEAVDGDKVQDELTTYITKYEDMLGK